MEEGASFVARTARHVRLLELRRRDLQVVRVFVEVWRHQVSSDCCEVAEPLRVEQLRAAAFSTASVEETRDYFV